MSQWGLNEKQLKLIRETFAKFPEIKEVRIFGSRAMGNFKFGSDVDIALYGKSGLECTTRISAILNQELPLPYQFDVVDYSQVTRPEFIQHIDRYGEQIYVNRSW